MPKNIFHAPARDKYRILRMFERQSQTGYHGCSCRTSRMNETGQRGCFLFSTAYARLRYVTIFRTWHDPTPRFHQASQPQTTINHRHKNRTSRMFELLIHNYRKKTGYRGCIYRISRMFCTGHRGCHKPDIADEYQSPSAALCVFLT